MSDDIDELRSAFGSSFPEGSENTVEFWFVLESNVRRDFGAFSQEMKMLRRYKKRYENQRAEAWEKGILPAWAENIALGKNIYAQKAGMLIWYSAIVTNICILIYLALVPESSGNLGISILCVTFGAFEIRNFCLGKVTLLEHIRTEGRYGKLVARWYGLVFDVLTIAFGVAFVFLG